MILVISISKTSNESNHARFTRYAGCFALFRWWGHNFDVIWLLLIMNKVQLSFFGRLKIDAFGDTFHLSITINELG